MFVLLTFEMQFLKFKKTTRKSVLKTNELKKWCLNCLHMAVFSKSKTCSFLTVSQHFMN